MYYTPYICHHGVKGQKWGVRRQLKKQQKENAKDIRKAVNPNRKYGKKITYANIRLTSQYDDYIKKMGPKHTHQMELYKKGADARFKRLQNEMDKIAADNPNKSFLEIYNLAVDKINNGKETKAEQAYESTITAYKKISDEVLDEAFGKYGNVKLRGGLTAKDYVFMASFPDVTND